MNSIRTGFLLSILATLIATSAAAGFPEKPIKFVLGFGAGGPTDIVARTWLKSSAKNLAKGSSLKTLSELLATLPGSLWMAK
jgi:tripartite-type tricarboxylate transporter receptor subunit TctC